MNKTLMLILAAVILLVGIGAGVYFLTRPPKAKVISIPTNPDVASRTIQPVPAVPFKDITAEAGIRFRHVNGATGRKLLPETMGSGVAFIDFDNDGKQDLLLINSRPWPGDSTGPAPTMALYRNKGDGTFEDVTMAMGLSIPLYGQGVCVGDYDNDGWPDIFVTAIGGNHLFHNDHGKGFTDVTAQAGLGSDSWGSWAGSSFLKHEKPIPWPTSATFLDFDGDGKLDLFVCQYVTWSPAIDLGIDFKLEGLGRAYGRPTSFDGSQCILYRNVDGKRFEDVSEQAGIHVRELEGIGPDARPRDLAKSLGVIVCDPDEDGWPDIVVANDTVRNFFFHNIPGPNGTRRYEEIGIRAGLAYAEGQARGAMGIDSGEVFPGTLAIVIGNFANEPSSFLCQNRKKQLQFSELAVAFGLSAPTLAPLKFGTFFFDYDLDGRLDILSTNGHLEPEIAKVQAGQTYAQAPQLFWNTGNKPGCFEPVTAAASGRDLFKPLVGRSSAYADIDGDGDPDLVITENNGPARLLRNDCKLGHHWVRLVLEGDGIHSNRSAIGASVTLEADGKIQTRYVAGAKGYLSQSELPVTFGLGKASKIDKVTIRWPGKDAGKPTVLTNVAIDMVRKVSQANPGK